jgi:hypothetical protein
VLAPIALFSSQARKFGAARLITKPTSRGSEVIELRERATTSDVTIEDGSITPSATFTTALEESMYHAFASQLDPALCKMSLASIEAQRWLKKSSRQLHVVNQQQNSLLPYVAAKVSGLHQIAAQLEVLQSEQQAAIFSTGHRLLQSPGGLVSATNKWAAVPWRANCDLSSAYSFIMTKSAVLKKRELIADQIFEDISRATTEALQVSSAARSSLCTGDQYLEGHWLTGALGDLGGRSACGVWRWLPTKCHLADFSPHLFCGSAGLGCEDLFVIGDSQAGAMHSALFRLLYGEGRELPSKAERHMAAGSCTPKVWTSEICQSVCKSKVHMHFMSSWTLEAAMGCPNIEGSSPFSHQAALQSGTVLIHTGAHISAASQEYLTKLEVATTILKESRAFARRSIFFRTASWGIEPCVDEGRAGMPCMRHTAPLQDVPDPPDVHNYKSLPSINAKLAGFMQSRLGAHIVDIAAITAMREDCHYDQLHFMGWEGNQVEFWCQLFQHKLQEHMHSGVLDG